MLGFLPWSDFVVTLSEPCEATLAEDQTTTAWDAPEVEAGTPHEVPILWSIEPASDTAAQWAGSVVLHALLPDWSLVADTYVEMLPQGTIEDRAGLALGGTVQQPRIMGLGPSKAEHLFNTYPPEPTTWARASEWSLVNDASICPPGTCLMLGPVEEMLSSPETHGMAGQLDVAGASQVVLRWRGVLAPQEDEYGRVSLTVAVEGTTDRVQVLLQAQSDEWVETAVDLPASATGHRVGFAVTPETHWRDQIHDMHACGIDADMPVPMGKAIALEWIRAVP